MLLRNLSLLATSVFVASFVLNIFSAPAALAADAIRSGQSIAYDGKTFTPIATGTPLPSGTGPAYRTPDGPTVSFLIFKNGSPDTATEAEYVTYDFSAPGTYTNERPIPHEQVKIQNSPGPPTPATSTCNSNVVGNIGWILCPTINYLASLMDNLYKILQDFLVVRNIQASPTSSLYKMWVIVRDIANVVFVLAFLIIIYSQITNFGLSNYAVKKALPRVVIAAVLVNLSFWICALAIDASNFLGYTVYDLLMGVFRSMNTSGVESPSWVSIAGLLLTGATGAFGGLVIAGGVEAAGKLLFAFLVGVVLAALVAVVILAARQAIITVLVIISPLAFVAYVLPNTEKYFDKWKDLFMTMLIMFPIFSLIFAGAQLAGMVIIQNANGSAVTILFGLAVQVAPVVVTPLLIKLSGSLLGRIASIVNNPKTGLLDRTRNWAKDSANYSASRVKAGHGRSPIAKTIRYLDRKNYARKQETKENEDFAQNMAEISRQRRKQSNSRQLSRELNRRQIADEANLQKARTDTLYEETKGGRIHDGTSAELQQRVTNTSEAIALEAIRKHQAESTYQSHLNEAMLKNQRKIEGKTLQEYAAGIGNQDMVLASVIAKDRKEFSENSAAQVELMKHFKVNAGQTERLAMGEGDVTIEIKDDSGNVTGTHTFRKDDVYTHDAAAERIFTVGSHGQKARVALSASAQFDAAGDVIAGTQDINYDYRATIQDAVIKSGFGKSAPAFRDKALDDLLNGKLNGEDGWNFHSMREIAEGRLSMNDIAEANAASLERMFSIQTVDNYNDLYGQLTEEAQENFATNFRRMHEDVKRILDSSNIRRNANSESVKVMNRFVGRKADDPGPS